MRNVKRDNTLFAKLNYFEVLLLKPKQSEGTVNYSVQNVVSIGLQNSRACSTQATNKRFVKKSPWEF
jgi:hypothetical protein